MLILMISTARKSKNKNLKGKNMKKNFTWKINFTPQRNREQNRLKNLFSAKIKINSRVAVDEKVSQRCGCEFVIP